MSYCVHCGTEMKSGAAFCPGCGKAAPGDPSAPLAAQSSPRPAGRFAENYLGFIIMGALLFAVAVLNIVVTLTGGISLYGSMGRFFGQSAYLYAIALGAAVSAWAKGPDLSIGPMLGLGATVVIVMEAQGLQPGGILLSLLLCAAIGAANGAIITYARVPAIITTLITGSLITSVFMLILNGQTIVPTRPLGYAVPAVLALFALAFALVLIYRSRAKGPGRAGVLLSYVLSAVFAMAAGYIFAARIGAATPAMGSRMEIFILFVYLAVTASRRLRNTMGVMLYALAPALVWGLLQYGMSVLGVGIFWQYLVDVMLVLPFAVIRFLAADRTVPATGRV